MGRRTTKEELLQLFENNKGTFFSGEDIAEKLNISRTAVWKSVQSLRNEGYKIEAIRNKGYCLSVDTDILSMQGIKKYLGPECYGIELDVLQSVTSTNAIAREKATAGAADGYTVVANSQTAGRGRMGRAFHSPADTGIYMSIVLRPENFDPQQAVKLTTMAAVAVCEAIESVSGEKAEIKWVNDVFVKGKKVCGILTEASFNVENGMLEYAVVGVGINVFTPEAGFPEELKSIAGAVFEEPENDGKNHIAGEFISHFMKYYHGNAGDPLEDGIDYTGEYRRRCFVVGRDVQVITPKGMRDAYVLDVDRDCRLLVEYEDGSRESLYSGEISVKLTNN